MARAGFIYVVIDPETDGAAPFTVKHELVTWLQRHPDPGRLALWRCRDGVHKQTIPSRMTLNELGFAEEAG
jgi:hypothetical protein